MARSSRAAGRWPSRSVMLELAHDQVDLWILDLPPGTSADVWPGIESRLSRDEIDAARRFVNDRHRVAYVVSHAALRTLISRYLGRAPHQLEFDRGEYGRPELRDGALRFNLSHTDGIAVIAVASRRDVGVDVERLDRRRNIERLAPAVLTEQELESFRGTPGEFFTLWTLKEAYAKARGGGLTLGFRNFGFRVEREPVLLCAPDFDDAASWRFTSFGPRPQTLVSAAARSRDELRWRVSDVAVDELFIDT